MASPLPSIKGARLGSNSQDTNLNTWSTSTKLPTEADTSMQVLSSIRSDPMANNQGEASADKTLHSQMEGLLFRHFQSTLTAKGSNELKPLILACPFFKQDPVKHGDCGRRLLRRIKDVKQHLFRRHTVLHYCMQCGRIFGDQDHLEQHLTQANFCTRTSDAFPIDGVTIHQYKLLLRKSNTGQSMVEQWYSIWDILFPKSQRPEYIWIDSTLESHNKIILNTILALGPRVLADSLDESITWIVRDPDDKFKILERAVRNMVEKSIGNLSWDHDFLDANELAQSTKGEAALANTAKQIERTIQREKPLPTDSGFSDAGSNSPTPNTITNESPLLYDNGPNSTDFLRAIKQLRELVSSQESLQHNIDELIQSEPRLQSFYRNSQGLEDQDSNTKFETHFASRECKNRRAETPHGQNMACDPYGDGSRQITPTNYTSSETNTDDSEESLTASQFSILDDKQTDLSHRFFTVEANAVREVVARYCAKECTSAGANTQGSSVKSNGLKESSGERNHESKKRRRPDGDTESEDDRSMQNAVKKGRKKLTEGSHPLACPFYKREPKQYARCFQQTFLEINRMKQHLRRNHKRGAFCGRCRKDFSSNEDLVDHINWHMENEPCQKMFFDSSIALSPDIMEKLGKKVDKNLSLSNQWYQVWDVIFPGAPRPPTCTIDPELSASLIDLRDFSEKQGPQIIINVLDKHHLRVASCLNDTNQDEAALSALTNRVLAKASQEIFAIWQVHRNTPISEVGDKDSSETESMSQPVPSICSNNSLPDYFINNISTPTGLETAAVHPNTELAHSGRQSSKMAPQAGPGNGSSDLLVYSPREYHNNIPLETEMLSGDGSEPRDTMFEAFGQNETENLGGLNFLSFPEDTDWFP